MYNLTKSCTSCGQTMVYVESPLGPAHNSWFCINCYKTEWPNNQPDTYVDDNTGPDRYKRTDGEKDRNLLTNAVTNGNVL